MAESKKVGDQTVHVYQAVIDDVIARVKPEFVQEGVDESVLDELRALWEAKLVSTGVLGDPNQAEAAQVLNTVSQLPRPGSTQYRQNSAAPPGAPQYQPPQYQQAQQGLTPLVQPQQRLQAQPNVPATAFAAPHSGVGDKRKLESLPMASAGPPLKREPNSLAQPGSQYVVQGQGVQQVRAQQVGQQQAGQPPMQMQSSGLPSQPGLQHAGLQHAGLQHAVIPQQDGPDDEGDAGEGDEQLNEEDDLADVDDAEVDEERLKDVVLGQFDKVSRTKARWKVQLKDCIITAQGRDYLVHKATGEMNF